MIPFQLFYDITSVKIKYEEGFASIFGHIFTKPEIMWTKADQNLVIPTEYSLCIGFSLQTGTLVLLQCFWNYLANSVARASFMSSKEFMFYIFWTFTSFIIFPLLQYNFSRDVYEPTYKEIMPEMVYGIELFIVACLGVVSHFRFKKLLANSRDTDNGRSIVPKILYFQEINLVLSTVLFGHGTLLTILSCDGLTGRKYLNAHKFSADFFICNINMCAVITWLCMILIFHPKHNATQSNPSTDDDAYTAAPLNNHSGISSNYGQTTTLVIENSQDSNDTMSYTKEGGVHPLSKSGMITPGENYDSGFHFGPLPTPPHAPEMTNRQNTSFSSIAPSVTTLVSHNNNYGSQGKSRSKSYTPSEYYESTISVQDDMAATPLYPTPLKQQQIEKKQKGYDTSVNDYPVDHYASPPPPVRRGQIKTENGTRKHSQSMIPSHDEDMSEFGLDTRAYGIGNNVENNVDEESYYRKTSSFQAAYYQNDNVLSSFREFGPPPISPLLAIDPAYSEQSSSNLQSYEPTTEERRFDFLPPPPSSLPPPPPL
ncbi:hypothetical protein G6F55_005264 [Rhizopus delemar]|uniref:Uncharacterized protein n=2 Tax=Rhizopus TaxID=4842 RepID=A0A9P6YXB8_9FUNG|nr:hypothetical protein G6F55_005264 [Rhizopus delemar]KAG1547656.1 hypothetical protein G6F51_004135 [Rhizopus arrhizus]KAG1522524.1 hypothetical protein G6F52_005788 [Rhizopus delemar]KAG1561412.1 hypothetical protein G6F49_001820 [Rhizopus delemar]KAG1566429.1 hypothetical protein G6F50_009153 [Rhizopus delemar]